MTQNMVDFVQAKTKEHFEQTKQLFIQYANSLNFDLCFQNFDKEISRLPGEYSSPKGCLILAVLNNHAVGCVGLRRISEETCEMKRLYVQPNYRGRKIGKRLAEIIIEKAKERDYCFMRLDTIPTMTNAIALYRKLGFVEIEPYRHNPIKGALFMELELQQTLGK